jgi:riboflavin kinase
MVMSIGWNPFFDNSSKTIEPWLLHEFPEDFYDQELRLTVLGYIRPECGFTTLVGRRRLTPDYPRVDPD